MQAELARTVIVIGHYGAGKTNFSLNLAMEYRSRGESVALADLDIVNPYFRTSEFTELAGRFGIELVASSYSGPGTSLDVPALTGRLDARIGRDAILIIDVGGDDAGATALGRYAARLEASGYSMLYVVNAYRYLLRDPEDGVGMLRDIEAASRLRATHIVNNSNLGAQTTAGDIRGSVGYAGRVSALAGLPVCCTAAKKELAPELDDIQELYPVEIYVKTPWD